MCEMFASSLRSAGDLAGVFEFDGDASYFYLYRVGADKGSKVIAAVKIGVGDPPFLDSEVDIIWSKGERLVSLQVAGSIVATFDCSER